MNQTIQFLNSINKLVQQDIPAAVLERAKRSLLDYLAVTCAGVGFQKTKLERYVEFAQPEEGRFKAIGMGKNLALKEAVFINGLNAHALDYDDGTNAGIIHLGSPIFSLLIPLAQRYEINVKDMLRAAVIGYEVSFTMAVSIQPGHKALGYHATGTCGTLGAVTAAAYMLGFSEEERFQAFAAACVAASGMLKVLDDGSELKPYNVAKTALLALTALQLAKAGFKGHDNPLGGRGFFKMMTGQEEVELKPVLLDGTYAVMKTYTKPYASCRYTHPPVEAALRLRNQLDPEDVETISIRTYDLAVSGHDHREIHGSYNAKMSTPYAVAAALLYGKAGLQEFTDECVGDERVLELASKVSVTADQKFSALFPQKQIADVEIKTKKEIFRMRVDFPKGEPENPMTDQEFEDRYMDLMAYAGIDSQTGRSVYESVMKGNATIRALVERL